MSLFAEEETAVKEKKKKSILKLTTTVKDVDKAVASKKPLIFFDVETTGISAQGMPNTHRVIQLGLIRIWDINNTKNIAEEDKVSVFFNPGRKSDADAFRVHGIEDEFLKTQGSFKDKGIKILKEYFADAIIIAHNAGFDVDFINHELEIAQADFRIEDIIYKRTIIDTIGLAKKSLGLSNNDKANLDVLCKRLKYPVKRGNHDALEDCNILANIFPLLIRKQTSGLFEIDISDDQIEYTEINKTRTKIISKLSAEEISEHNDFLQYMKDKLMKQKNKLDSENAKNSDKEQKVNKKNIDFSVNWLK